MCAMYIPYIFVVSVSTPWLNTLYLQHVSAKNAFLRMRFAQSLSKSWRTQWFVLMATPMNEPLSKNGLRLLAKPKLPMKGVADFFVRITYGVYIAISD